MLFIAFLVPIKSLIRLRALQLKRDVIFWRRVHQLMTCPLDVFVKPRR